MRPESSNSLEMCAIHFPTIIPAYNIWPPTGRKKFLRTGKRNVAHRQAMGGDCISCASRQKREGRLAHRRRSALLRTHSGACANISTLQAKSRPIAKRSAIVWVRRLRFSAPSPPDVGAAIVRAHRFEAGDFARSVDLASEYVESSSTAIRRPLAPSEQPPHGRWRNF